MKGMKEIKKFIDKLNFNVMYKKFSFLRNVAKILVVSLVAATVFTGCKKEEVKPEKTIIITDIPAMYNGKIGVLSVGSPTLAMAMVNINGTSTTFRLMDFNTNKPWTGEGNHEFVFLIYENFQAMTDKETLWDGYLQNWKISGETTTIGWGEFLNIKD